MTIKLLTLGVMLSAAAPGVAMAHQSPAPHPLVTSQSPAVGPASGVVDPLREPIQQMGIRLVTAVRAGAENYAAEVNAVAPNLQLYTGIARAHGFPTPAGVFFDVEMPSVNGASIDLYRQIYQTPGFQGTPTATPVSNALSSPAFQDPAGEYHSRVTEALVDTMIEYTALKPGEWLTVAARGLDNSVLTSSVLMLEVKEEDLAAYHAGKINKDQARGKVQVKWF